MEKVKQETKYGVLFHIYEHELSKYVITCLTASFSTHIPEEMLGYMSKSIESMHYKPFIYLSCFGTFEGMRHKGYGRKMIQWVKEYFKGCVLWLEVGSGILTNEQLINFYESEGFTLIDIPKEYAYHPVMYIDL